MRSIRDVAPAWGWRGPGTGRAAHVSAGTQYQGTTTQICGLYPFVAGSGAPSVGVPIGRHMLWGEVVCLDPLEWVRAGLVTNPGLFVLGQPGVGKSTIAKRLATGMAATGVRLLVLGDTKPDYTDLVNHLGGQVIRIGRGLDRINPLDAGPLGAALRRMTSTDAEQVRLEVRGRRMSLLLALCALVRGRPVNNGEEVVLGRAIDLLADASTEDPTVPQVLGLIEAGHSELHSAARARTPGEYRRRVDELVPTLALLCDGTLRGVFDAPTSRQLDLEAPAVSVDISRVAAAGDTLVAAALLSVWSYGHALVDAAAVLADHQLAPRRKHLAVMDELWRALRGASGLVEHADALSRLNRAKGMATIMVTHSLADLDALPTASDRAKAQGFVERAAIKVLAGLPPRELERVGEVVRLNPAERDLVASWAAPEAWLPGAAHPGRGKYLIKTGDRPGLPVALTLVGDELALYDTDQKMRSDSGWSARNFGGERR
jgi:energy-coupling factor transporter ATP-binding protein EcfA2